MIQSINLYTEDMRPQRDLLTLPHLVAAALVAIAIVASASAYANWRAHQSSNLESIAESRAAELHAQVAADEKRLEGRVEDSALQADLEQLTAALRHRDQLVQRVEQLASRSAAGFSPYMLGLANQAVDGVWLTGMEIDRDTGDLVLKGLTSNGSLVPLYLEQLRSEPVFNGRRFRYFRLDRPEDGSEILSFRVAAQVGNRGPEK